jgi:hypothetical protein
MKEMTAEQIKEFELLVKPVIKYLNENSELFSPHTEILITGLSAKITDDRLFIPIDDFIK